jgi:uncharacterized phage protein (TIGR01671 family)
MSRPIEIRAWDKNNNRFIDVNGFDTNFGSMENKGRINTVYEQGELYAFDIDEVELEQFTGLLDKNGTKIYEGDILRWNDEEKGYALAWNEIDCCYSFCNWDLCDDGSIDILEVIGNIHQNQELLKEQQHD